MMSHRIRRVRGVLRFDNGLSKPDNVGVNGGLGFDHEVQNGGYANPAVQPMVRGRAEEPDTHHG